MDLGRNICTVKHVMVKITSSVIFIPTAFLQTTVTQKCYFEQRASHCICFPLDIQSRVTSTASWAWTLLNPVPVASALVTHYPFLLLTIFQSSSRDTDNILKILRGINTIVTQTQTKQRIHVYWACRLQVNTTCFWARWADLMRFNTQSWPNTFPFPSSMKSLCCTMCNIEIKGHTENANLKTSTVLSYLYSFLV